MSRTPGSLTLILLATLSRCGSPAVTPGAGTGGSRGSEGGHASGGAGANGGGASGGGGFALPARSLLRLEVAPGNDVLEVDRGQTGTRAFTVTLTRGDGSREDVTAKAALTADNPAAGT